MYKKYLLASVLAGCVSFSGAVYAGEMEAIVKDNTTSSGFSVKEETTGSTIARFRGDGNVGIGNTSPSEKLDVTGTVKASAFVGDGSGLTNLPSSGGSVDGNSLDAKDGAPADALFVDDNGNVGIGTKNPTFLLTLKGAKDTGATILSFDAISSVSNNRVDQEFLIGATTDSGSPGDTSKDLIFMGAAAKDFNVGGNGNVGIGTTAPTEKLDVVGNVKATKFIGDGSGLTNLSGDGGSGDGHSLDASDGAPADALFVDSNGNVGIGTTAPTQPFQISSGDNVLVFKTNDPIGKAHVGIGTTDPTNSVHIKSHTASVRFESTVNDDAYCQFIESTSSEEGFVGKSKGLIKLVHGSGFETNTNGIIISSNGNVGIGAPSSTEKLEVNGNIMATGAITPGSSREIKKDIFDVSTNDAMNAVMGLKPVKFKYKADNTGEEYLGFIAEDVPELVAMNDRKHINTMDLTAVFAKVIQEQQKMLQAQQEAMAEMKQEINMLKSGRNYGVKGL